MDIISPQMIIEMNGECALSGKVHEIFKLKSKNSELIYEIPWAEISNLTNKSFLMSFFHRKSLLQVPSCYSHVVTPSWISFV
jgi:hypothetical protein